MATTTEHGEPIAIAPLDVELTAGQAAALAQFVKRIGWQALRANAVDRLQDSLARQGFAPR